MSDKLNKPITFADYPDELRKAYDDPDGDIMWRAGIARAAAIFLKGYCADHELIEALKDAYPHVASDSMRLRIGRLIARAEGVNS